PLKPTESLEVRSAIVRCKTPYGFPIPVSYWRLLQNCRYNPPRSWRRPFRTSPQCRVAEAGHPRLRPHRAAEPRLPCPLSPETTRSRFLQARSRQHPTNAPCTALEFPCEGRRALGGRNLLPQ